MKTIIHITLVLSLIVIFSCSSQHTLQLSVTNQTSLSLTDVFVTAVFDTSIKSFSVYEGDNIIASQLLISNENKEVGFVVNLNPSETKQIVIKSVNEKPEFKSRTYAELSMKPGNVYFDGRFRGDKFVNVTKLKVPSIHTDHDALFRYEDE
mgnify:CR=1 FL=1